jgi:hypothetical protein
LDTKRRQFNEQFECIFREASTAIEIDYVAKESLFRGEKGFFFELGKDFLHFIEHFSTAKLGNDEVIREKRVAKGFRRGFWVWIFKELKSEFRVFLETKKRG